MIVTIKSVMTPKNLYPLGIVVVLAGDHRESSFVMDIKGASYAYHMQMKIWHVIGKILMYATQPSCASLKIVSLMFLGMSSILVVY